MSRFDSLLEFCSNYSHIYCYGAGNIGVRTVCFLYKYGIKVDGYIVSKKNMDNVLGIKVWQIDEIVAGLNQQTGIILSLGENNHEKVLEKFTQFGVTDNAGFFRIYYRDAVDKMTLDLAGGISYFPDVNKSITMNTFVENIYGMELSKAISFENRYKEIHKQYEKIIFAQYDMRRIGVMCLTYYIWNIERKGEKKVLYVMSPFFFDNDYEKVPNAYFFHKIQEKIEIITNENYEFWRWMLQHHADEIEFSDKYSWMELKKRDMDYIDACERCFEVELDIKEQGIIDKMNLGDRFVCIYSRDDAYYKAMGTGSDTEEYRAISKARNSSIMDYELLGKEYLKKNIKLVRMGYQVSENIEMDGIVDYANHYRTEKLDFYFISKCAFFIVSGSGIMLIAKLFHTPIVMVNTPILSFGGDMVVPMSPKNDLVIMKKLWYQKQNRYLSLDEILYMEEKFQSYELFKAYHDMGVTFQSNSQEELLEIAEEMRGRIEGTYIYTDEDEKMQEQYRSILSNGVKQSRNHYYNGRYGADFLRKNSWFLEDVPAELSIRNIMPEHADG